MSCDNIPIVVKYTTYARVAQRWSISLPRRGSRVRFPSRAFFVPGNSCQNRFSGLLLLQDTGLGNE